MSEADFIEVRPGGCNVVGHLEWERQAGDRLRAQGAAGVLIVTEHGTTTAYGFRVRPPEWDDPAEFVRCKQRSAS